MGCSRALLCLLPPIAVLDRGIGTIVIVTILTILGYIPGVLAALFINFSAGQSNKLRKDIRRMNDRR